MTLSEDLYITANQVATLEDLFTAQGALVDELETRLTKAEADWRTVLDQNVELVNRIAELEALLASLQGRCGLGGAGNIAALETAGGPLTYHRTYHPNADDVGLTKEKATISAGREPLSSFKPVVGGIELRWQAIADASDVGLAWAVKLAKAYGSLPAGGYVTCLHEPLDDAKRTGQTGAAYRAMSARLCGIFWTYAPKWKWAICLTGYHLGQTGQYAASEYWDPGASVFAVDEYSGSFFSTKTVAQAFERARNFAAARGVKLQIWETGVVPASEQGPWIRELRSYLKAHPDVEACAYFNQRDPQGRANWTLGADGLAAWGEMARDPWFAKGAS